jgi:hypothetical protein
LGWKDLDFSERWSLLVSTIQALATVGAFLVAAIGIWRVTPIITYQIERQKSEALPEVGAAAPESALSSQFVNEVVGWWVPRVRAYARTVELIRTREQQGAQLSYELVLAPKAGPGELPQPDLLVVRAVRGARAPEVVTVPVNEQALRLGHFIQREVNRGAFAALEPETRQRVEHAVESYVRAHILPRTPPPHLRSGMTLDEIADEIAHHQDDRVNAARQIEGLREIIEGASRG